MAKQPKRAAKRASKPSARSTKKAAARATKPGAHRAARAAAHSDQLVVITGLSGSGKATILKVFEDLGWYCVDNLPSKLIPQFVDLVKQSRQIERAALVVDVREGEHLGELPDVLQALRTELPTTIIYLEAEDNALIRRFSETRRPHPLGGGEEPVRQSIAGERSMLEPIRAMADVVLDTTNFNVHELRAHVMDRFRQGAPEQTILVTCESFGYKHGVPHDCDLLFDVRFLPNPHFIPEFRPLTGLDPQVAKYVRSFKQTGEFIERISKLLVYLLPHYVKEGKSYLTIGFGCTGGQHRSVMIAEDVGKKLSQSGYNVKVLHRDKPES